MAIKLLHKKSNVQGRKPTTSDLDLGQIGINTYDGKLFTKRDNGTASIIEVDISGLYSLFKYIFSATDTTGVRDVTKELYDLLQTANGQIVFIPPGTYRINDLDPDFSVNIFAYPNTVTFIYDLEYQCINGNAQKAYQLSSPTQTTISTISKAVSPTNYGVGGSDLVTKLTVASATGFSLGDVVHVASNDLEPWWTDGNSGDNSGSRYGESGVILDINGSDIYLSSILEYHDYYQTTPYLTRFKTDRTFSIYGIKFKANGSWTANANVRNGNGGYAINLWGFPFAKIKNCRAEEIWTGAFTIRACPGAEVDDNTTYHLNNYKTGSISQLLGTNPLSVTSGSPYVTVTQTSHGLSTGDHTSLKNISGTIGGLTTSYTNKQGVWVEKIDNNTWKYLPYRTNASDRGLGIVSSVQSSTQFTDFRQSWTTNTHTTAGGSSVYILSGTGAGQIRAVAANTSNTITVTSAWSPVPDTTSIFIISKNATSTATGGGSTVTQYWGSGRLGYGVQVYGTSGNTRVNNLITWQGRHSVTSGSAQDDVAVSGTATGGSVNTITGAFGATSTVGKRIYIMSGTGINQQATISTHTSTQLTISTNWTTIPDSTSVFNILGTFDITTNWISYGNPTKCVISNGIAYDAWGPPWDTHEQASGWIFDSCKAFFPARGPSGGAYAGYGFQNRSRNVTVKNYFQDGGSYGMRFADIQHRDCEHFIDGVSIKNNSRSSTFGRAIYCDDISAFTYKYRIKFGSVEVLNSECGIYTEAGHDIEVSKLVVRDQKYLGSGTEKTYGIYLNGAATIRVNDLVCSNSDNAGGSAISGANVAATIKIDKANISGCYTDVTNSVSAIFVQPLYTMTLGDIKIDGGYYGINASSAGNTLTIDKLNCKNVTKTGLLCPNNLTLLDGYFETIGEDAMDISTATSKTWNLGKIKVKNSTRHGISFVSGSSNTLNCDEFIGTILTSGTGRGIYSGTSDIINVKKIDIDSAVVPITLGTSSTLKSNLINLKGYTTNGINIGSNANVRIKNLSLDGFSTTGGIQCLSGSKTFISTFNGYDEKYFIDSQGTSIVRVNKMDVDYRDGVATTNAYVVRARSTSDVSISDLFIRKGDATAKPLYVFYVGDDASVKTLWCGSLTEDNYNNVTTTAYYNPSDSALITWNTRLTQRFPGNKSLDALASLTPAADKLGYYSSSTAASLTDLSSFSRTLLDDTDADTARTTLVAQKAIQFQDETVNVGTSGTISTINFAGTGVVASESSGTLTVTVSGAGGGLSDGDYGDITLSSSASVWTIDNDAVTYAKIQNVTATDKILGRVSTGAGDIEEITFTDFAQSLADDIDAATARATLGLDSISTQSAASVAITGGSITGLSNTGLSVLDTDASHTLTFKPGSNLTANKTLTITTGDSDRTLTMSGNATITGSNTGDQNIFSTISVSGQSDVLADSTADTLTFANGTNIAITTNATTDTITVSATGLAAQSASSVAITGGSITGTTMGMHPGYVSGRYYYPTNTGVNIGTTSVTANRLWLLPFYAAETKTWTKLGINVTATTAAAGKKARLGIYNNSGGVPTTLLLDAGEVAIDAVAAVEATISQSLTGGNWYWLAFISDDSNVTVSAYSTTNMNLGMWGSSTIGGVGTSVRITQTYGVLPSSVTIASTDFAATTAVLVTLRY